LDPIPDDVKRFIDGCIETVDQVEILSVLSGQPELVWEAASLAREAEVAAANVAAELAALHARGLLAAEKRGAGTVYRYGPATEELAGLVARLLEVYRERPVSAIKAIYARPKDAIRRGPRDRGLAPPGQAG
jgi:hypothetical protein